MRYRFLLSIFPLILFFACSTEDPESDPLPPQAEEPEPADEKDTEAPSVPQELIASDKSFEGLTLSWKASTDNEKVVKYHVFENNSKLTEVEGTTATLTGLSPGESYSFSVTALDASENTSEKSRELKVEMPIDTDAPSVPDGLSLGTVSENNASLSWNSSTDNAGVLEYAVFLNGELYGSTLNTELILENLIPNTTYSVKILARDIYRNNSPLSQALEFTTETSEEAPPETTSGALYFSEYIEGSSNNKALELANTSESEVDLSLYSLKKISNENEKWDDEKKLEGILAAGEVLVIAHSEASPEILGRADLQLGGGVMDFNGNDVIGLFQQGELIDIIGTAGGENFAKDVTLRRRSSVAAPNATYNPEEWEVLEMDTVDGLGNL